MYEFGEKWNKKYPQIYKSWVDNWTELSTFFKYPEEVRRLIYTTNAVEGFHRMLRKYTKTKTTYTKLFQSQTRAINILQEAQKETEDIYIEAEPPKMVMLPTNPKDKAGENKNDKGEDSDDE